MRNAYRWKKQLNYCRKSERQEPRNTKNKEQKSRHHLTEALRNGVGHIGYSIKRDERGKGYGTAGLKLTLLEAKKIVPEDEIYLRVNKDNIASQKVMLKNGGKIVGEDEGHFFVRIQKNT